MIDIGDYMIEMVKGFYKSICEIFEYKELLINLTVKELKLKYRNSVLGFFWSFLNPIMTMIVYTFVFTFIIPNKDELYTVKLLAALLPWQFFQAAVQGSTNSIVSNSNLIKKVYFPREIIPLSIILSSFVNFVITLVILFAAMIIYHIKVGFVIFLYPVVLILLLLFSIGLSFILSSLNVLYRDISHFVEIIFMLWMYLTPVIYPIEYVDKLPKIGRVCFQLNPMTMVVESCRRVLLYDSLPKWFYIAGLIIIDILILIVGNKIFRKIEKVFAEEI